MAGIEARGFILGGAVAMGLEAEEALASLRISFGMTNTMSQVEDFVGVFAREVEALRQLTPAMQP